MERRDGGSRGTKERGGERKKEGGEGKKGGSKQEREAGRRD